MGVEVTFTHVQAHFLLRTKWNKPNQCNKSWSHMLTMAHPHTEGRWFSSVHFSHSVVSDSLQPHEPQHTRPPCLSPTLEVHLNPCLLHWQVASLPLSHLGSPCIFLAIVVSCSMVSDSLRPHGLQHTKLLCPSLFPGLCENSRPLNQWCHPTISSFVIPFSFCPQSFPASGSFPMSWLFASGDQGIGHLSTLP